MNVKRVGIYILNYNGAEYVGTCIDSILKAIRNSAFKCDLTVIDNSSTDESVNLIKTRFPKVPIMQMENRVLCSFNEVVKQSQADVVFLLNNDLNADPFFIDPLVSIFAKQTDVFLVAPKSYLPNGSYEGGRSIPFIKFGFFGTTCHFNGFEKFKDEPGITFAAGFGAFDREKFLALGGYDDLYLPGRLEDADLAFRAWRKGWKSYYEPQSILHHLGAKSFKERFGTRGTMELAHRNTFLFMWKNIHSAKYWFSHFIFLIPRMFWMLCKGQPEFIAGFCKALRHLRKAFNKCKKEKENSYQFSDQNVISFFNHAY